MLFDHDGKNVMVDCVKSTLKKGKEKARSIQVEVCLAKVVEKAL